MKNYFPVYREIKNWVVLDTATVYDFSEDEHPIDVVELLIGTLHYQTIGLNQHFEERRTPIIRWITKKNYEHLLANEGTIIW